MVFRGHAVTRDGPPEHQGTDPIRRQSVRRGHGRIVFPGIHRGAGPQVQRARRQPGARHDVGQHQQMAPRARDVRVRAGLLRGHHGPHGFRRPSKEHRRRVYGDVRGGLLLRAQNERDHGQAFQVRRMGVETGAGANARRRVADTDERLPRGRRVPPVPAGSSRSRWDAHYRTETFATGKQ